ncbi:DnaD domain-containing protein [Fredinandcohnia sp. 179-A 10B2 NHS]|uniref:DnaD domain-containing protein n=1 Tax=Fredinandcohnia sp. 179-A 10B2 NHS TaxID=3235176 RepID=UPI0039A3345E
MGKFRMVGIDFWNDPVVVEEMTPEDRYFYLYLLTNPRTTQIGIYKITKKHMACDLGYSVESVQSLMDRFINHHQVIRYNPETREIAIKDWGTNNLRRGGKPVMDCVLSELKKVKDRSLISYVSENISRSDILGLYESFIEIEDETTCRNHNTYKNTAEWRDMESYEDTPSTRDTIRGQEEEKEKEEEKQQQDLYPNIDYTPNGERSVVFTQQDKDIKEILEFWDQNGFGYTNVHGKDRLLMWLYDSSFLNPKEIIVKAMQLACSNNKRRLNYVEGILKNWENESLLTVEEIDLELENKPKEKRQAEKQYTGRDIPTDFEFDINAGEKE